MEPVLCLLPSPLLGPSSWRPVADVLSDRGWAVADVPRPSRAPRCAADALGTYLAAIPSDRDVVLIPHSNAGLFVPSLAAQRRVAGYVFVDAGLPVDAGSSVPMIPAGFSDMLAGKADDAALLPPWTQWWDGEDLSGLFPDARTREIVEREQQRLPLSYFEDSVPVPAGWPARPGAYLAFGDTYAAERAAALAQGWPVATLPGEHLHMLVDPEGVATAITDLIAKIGNLAA
jgi:hypothetical protein